MVITPPLPHISTKVAQLLNQNRRRRRRKRSGGNRKRSSHLLHCVPVLRPGLWHILGVFFLLLSFCLCWVVGGGSDITALGVRQCRSFITLPSPPSLPLGLLGNNGRRGCTARDDRCSSSKITPHTNHQSVLTSQAPSRSIEASVIWYRFPAAH